MRKLGLVLLLTLLAGCSTPDRHRDLGEPGGLAMRPAEPSPLVGFICSLLYGLGQWLGPKT